MIMKNCRTLSVLVVLICCSKLFSAVPTGYYIQTDGQSRETLKSKLYTIIKDHTVLTYSELWTAFRSTDVRPDGKVWDVYSNTTHFDFVVDQDSGFSGGSEGQRFNREHSFPNSWFGGNKDSAMYTDLFHLYPADKWVNAQRGNMPFGNVQTVSGFSAYHYCEWGTSTESGSLLSVFEPADEMKGDFARTYFYMVTRYENVVAKWTQYNNTQMLSGNSYPALSAWALKVLLAWHKLDPVSVKERTRNDIIYQNYQHNRNPFIDIPQLVDYVWGDSTSFAFHPAKYLTSSNLKSNSVNTDLSAWRSGDGVCVYALEGTLIRIHDIWGRLLAEKRSDGTCNFFTIKKNQLILISAGANRLKIKL
jgi:endonuclease I